MTGQDGKISAQDKHILKFCGMECFWQHSPVRKKSTTHNEQLADANRQPTPGLDELPCLGLQSHSRHVPAIHFARSWSVCRDGGIGRRSGLKIRRGQPLASSSLAPGTKLNQRVCEDGSRSLTSPFLRSFCRSLAPKEALHQRRGQAPVAAGNKTALAIFAHRSGVALLQALASLTVRCCPTMH